MEAVADRFANLNRYQQGKSHSPDPEPFFQTQRNDAKQIPQAGDQESYQCGMNTSNCGPPYNPECQPKFQGVGVC